MQFIVKTSVITLILLAFNHSALLADSYLKLIDNKPIIQGTTINIKAKSKKISRLWINGKEVPISPRGQIREQINGAIGKNKLSLLFQTTTGQIKDLSLDIICLPIFTDTKEHWAKEEISRFLAYYKIQPFISENKFHPDKLLNKGDLALLLFKSSHLAEATIKKEKNSLYGHDWRNHYISLLSHYFPIKKQGKGINPKGNVTRTELINWISTVYKQSNKNSLLPENWQKEKQNPYKLVTKAEAIWCLSQVRKIRGYMQAFYPKPPIQNQKDTITYYEEPTTRQQSKRYFIKQKIKRRQGKGSWGRKRKIEESSISKTSENKSNQEKQEKTAVNYVVESGDTLPRIAKKLTGNSKNWEQIADFNNLEKIPGKKEGEFRCLIFIGQTLKIPKTL